jgi:hypothetical protein
MSKYSTTSEYITVDKEIWSINAGCSKAGYPLAIYTKPMKAIINQLNAMTKQYSRVLVIRFDLHLEKHTDNNEQLSKFIKLLFNRLRAKYKLNDIDLPKHPDALILPAHAGGEKVALGVDALPDTAQICSCFDVKKIDRYEN